MVFPAFKGDSIPSPGEKAKECDKILERRKENLTMSNPFRAEDFNAEAFVNAISFEVTSEEFHSFLESIEFGKELQDLYDSGYVEPLYPERTIFDDSEFGQRLRKFFKVCFRIYHTLYRLDMHAKELMNVFLRSHPRLIYIVTNMGNEPTPYVPYNRNLSGWLYNGRDDLFRILFETSKKEEWEVLFRSQVTKQDIGKEASAELIDLLVEHGIVFDWHDLQEAIAKHNVYAVRVMFEQGAMMKKPNCNWYCCQQTPTFHGFLSYALEIIHLSAMYGGNVNEINEDGDSVLSVFFNYPQTEECDEEKCLVTLLDYGPDIKFVEEKGISPLHRVLLWGYSLPTIQRLVAAGANVHYLDKNGRGVMDYTRDEEIREYFRSLGVKSE